MQSSDVILLGQSMDQLLQGLPARISSPLQQWATVRPDALAACDHLGQVCNFRQLSQRVTAAQTFYRAQGVVAGDRVLLINENCVALLVAILALSEIDAISVVVNARLASAEIRRIQQHCQPRLTVCLLDSQAAEAHWLALQNEQLSEHVRLDGARLGLLMPETSALPLDESAMPVQERVCVMIYTTGTTGDPKGVMLTHRNILYVAAVTGVLRGMTAQDRICCVLPISHIFGLAAVFLAALYRGAALVLADRFDPAAVLQTLRDQHITGLLGVPTMYARLLEHARAERMLAADMPRLRFLYSGGAPLDPTIKRDTEALFGVSLLNAYGMTESGPTICQVRWNERLDNCSVGRPLPGLEIRLRDAQGREAAQGEVGELHVRGPGVMRGYYRNPEATAAVIDAEGYLNTGDLVRVDGDGNVHIAGRTKELIIHSGFNVYPPEVEAVIARHPDVVLCAVIGERAAGNELVVACVQTVAGSALDAVTLQAFIKAELAPYKRPSRIVFMQLPTAPSGKVLKHRLQVLVTNS